MRQSRETRTHADYTHYLLLQRDYAKNIKRLKCRKLVNQTKNKWLKYIDKGITRSWLHSPPDRTSRQPRRAAVQH